MNASTPSFAFGFTSNNDNSRNSQPQIVEVSPGVDVTKLAESLRNRRLTDVKIIVREQAESSQIIQALCRQMLLVNLTVEFGENCDIITPISIFLRENSSIKTLQLKGIIYIGFADQLLEGLAANKSLTQLDLNIAQTHASQFTFEKKLKEALTKHGEITQFSKQVFHNESIIIAQTAISVARRLLNSFQFSFGTSQFQPVPNVEIAPPNIPLHPPDVVDTMIQLGKWEELAKYLVQNCGEKVLDINPSNISLSTKTFIDKLAIHSLKTSCDILQQRNTKLQNELETQNRATNKLRDKRDKLHRELAEVEAQITSADKDIRSHSIELTKTAEIMENLRKNLQNYEASLKKNTPVLKRWQEQLQQDISSTWANEDVLFFLKEIGLGKYSRSFMRNIVDGAMLVQLETTDLLSVFNIQFKDAKKLLMYIYLAQTQQDIYTIPPGVLQWNNDTVCTWLEDNKFGHLIGVFRKHKITGAELVFLEKADLTGQLQIKSIADVIKLQKEISRLKESIFNSLLLPNRNNNNFANSHLERQLEELKRFNEELKIALKASKTKIPEAFICPITQDMMTDPVVASDGHTYERIAIEQWLQTKNTSPMTGLQLSNKQLTPSHTLKSMIREFIDANKNK